MIDFVLDHEVLGRTYFTVSPIADLVLSLHQLGRPRHPVHARWQARVRNKVADLDLPLLFAVAPPRRRMADFLLLPSATSRTRIEDQLQELVRIDADDFAAQLGYVWGSEMPRRVRQLVDAGSDGIAELAEQLAGYWDRALRDVWPRMLGVLEADIGQRSVQLTAEGLYRTLTDLHPEVSAGDGVMQVHKPHLPPEVLRAAGMTLTPSIFVWPQLIIQDGEHGRFGLIYSPRGVATTWEGLPGPDTVRRLGQQQPPQRIGADPLASLLGRTRAAILRRADVPVTTTQLARELGQSLASVNEHLTLLRDNGLLSSRRAGRSVLYSQTALARSLVDARETA